MIPYYLREIPGNQLNSSQETPVFWHHANPEIGLFAFIYGLGGIIDRESALNITADVCRQIEQRTDLKQEKEVFLKGLLNDTGERLLIGGGRRDRPQGLKSMLDLVWRGEKEKAHIIKVGNGKIYALHNDGRVFSIEEDNPASFGLGRDVSIKTQNLSDYKGILLAPQDLFQRVTDSEAIKILQRNSGRPPLEKLIELEKKIFEPELALLDKYSPKELIEMLRLYGKDSFIPEKKEMLTGVVAAVSAQTPELRERILSDLGIGHISLLYIDLEDTEGKARVNLQAESTERMERIVSLEGEKSAAAAAKLTAEARERTIGQEAEAVKRRADRLECLQQKIYSALRLEEVENPEEVVLNAIDYAKKREAGLEEQLREAEERMREIKSILGQEKGELKDISDKYLLLEGKHQRLAGDYSSLQKHNDSIREHYEAMLAASRKEKEQAEGELNEGREYSSALEGKIRKITGVVEALVSAIGLAEFNSDQIEGLEEKADEKLGEERQRYARLVDVLRKETAEKEAYQLTAGQLTEKISTLTSAYDGLVDEAAGRGKKIAELLADYAQLGEENEKLKGQVEEASGQIIRLHADGEGYIERARTAEERLRKLTEDAIRQGTVLNGLKELVEASEKGRLEYQRLHEDSMEEIIGLRLKIEEYQSKEQDWERRLSEAMQSVRTEIVTEETTGKGREVQREESQIIMFSEESLQRIRAIADKYRVGK